MISVKRLHLSLFRAINKVRSLEKHFELKYSSRTMHSSLEF